MNKTPSNNAELWLEADILQALRKRSPMPRSAIAEETHPPSANALARALMSLRKAGKIRFVYGLGWTIARTGGLTT